MSGSVDSILVCRLSALGDVVLSLPVVEALRERFPDAHLEFLSREPYGRVLRDVAWIDRLHLWPGPDRPLPEDVAKRRWSLLVDLSATGRSRRLLTRVRADRRLRAAKESVKRWAFVKLRWMGAGSVRPAPAVDRMFSCLGELGLRREGRRPRFDVAPSDPAGPVIVAPGAGRATKRWPADRFREVVERLAAAGREVRVVGAEAERGLLAEVAAGSARARVAAVADPGELPATIAGSSVALVNDSGILHVAEACGVPVVAVFGPTHPRLGFGPLLPGSAVVRTGIACSPCDLHGPHRCPLGHHRCMTELGVDNVAAEVFARLPAEALR